MKYNIEDMELVAKDPSKLDEVCAKYNVPNLTFVKAMNKHGFYIRKKKFKIITPYKTKIVYSMFSCACELNVREQTIRNYLKGKKVKVFEELGVKIEEVK